MLGWLLPLAARPQFAALVGAPTRWVLPVSRCGRL
jgi:hypothetical protein